MQQERISFKFSLAKSFAAAFPRTMPVFVTFLILGIAYSMIMQSKGYGFPWPLLMSAIAFCGSMQYVAITLLTVPFDPPQAFVLSLLVNARHCFYTLSMLEPYRKAGKWKAFLLFSLCDETFSVITTFPAPNGAKKEHYYFAVSFLNYCYWLFGTALGCLAGNVLRFNSDGMDFSLTALFIVMLLEQCKKKEARLPAALGVVLSVTCLYLFGVQDFILPSLIAVMASLSIFRKISQNRKTSAAK